MRSAPGRRYGLRHADCDTTAHVLNPGAHALNAGAHAGAGPGDPMQVAAR